MSRKLSRNEKIGIGSAIVAAIVGVAGLVLMIISPEVRVWLHLERPATPVTTPIAAKPPQTLEEIFKMDFPNLNKWSYSGAFVDPKDGTSIPMEEQMHVDYQGYSRFLSFYLPYSPHTYSACLWIADHSSDILAQMDKNEVTTYAPAEQHGISTKELKFSGRIYIYTLSHFTLKEQAELDEKFKRNGLALEMRGLTYMDLKNLTR